MQLPVRMHGLRESSVVPPHDVDNLWGDPTKAKTVLGWNPQSTTYEQLVEIMAKHDRERAKREKALKAVL